MTMCVTYQFNLIIQFSDNVCDKSGELYHCIIRFADNVRDISGLVKSKGYTKAANIRSFNRNQKKNNVETILTPYYRLRTENKCKCGSSNRNNKKVM